MKGRRQKNTEREREAEDGMEGNYVEEEIKDQKEEEDNERKEVGEKQDVMEQRIIWWKRR